MVWRQAATLPRKFGGAEGAVPKESARPRLGGFNSFGAWRGRVRMVSTAVSWITTRFYLLRAERWAVARTSSIPASVRPLVHFLLCCSTRQFYNNIHILTFQLYSADIAAATWWSICASFRHRLHRYAEEKTMCQCCYLKSSSAPRPRIPLVAIKDAGG